MEFCSCGLMMFLGGTPKTGMFYVCQRCDPHHMDKVMLPDPPDPPHGEPW